MKIHNYLRLSMSVPLLIQTKTRAHALCRFQRLLWTASTKQESNHHQTNLPTPTFFSRHPARVQSLRISSGSSESPPAEWKRSIVGFHLDNENHWVAELECGHNQHVRHDPPMVERPWVLTQDGRDSFLGYGLVCLKCSRGEPKDRAADENQCA